MWNIRTTVLSVVLVLILMLSVRLVANRTDVVSVPSNESAAVMENRQSTNQEEAPIPSYRSPLDECFDVPLMEADSCRKASQTPESPTLIPSYRSPLDECFDVSLREVASCRDASQKPSP